MADGSLPLIGKRIRQHRHKKGAESVVSDVETTGPGDVSVGPGEPEEIVTVDPPGEVINDGAGAGSDTDTLIESVQTRRAAGRRPRRRSDSLVAERNASFPRVADANFNLVLGGPGDREAREAAVAQLTAAFEEEAGPIIDAYYGPWIGAAAALTGAPPDTDYADAFDPRLRHDLGFRSLLHIHRVYKLSDANADAVQLLMGCDVLYQRARINLPREDGDRVISMTFGIVKALLSLLEAREEAREVAREEAGPGNSETGLSDVKEKTMAMLRSELERAQEQYDDAIEVEKQAAAADYQLLGRRIYLFGMLPVALFVLPVLAVVGHLALRSQLPVGRTQVGLGAATFIAGAIGAAVSVMLRMTRGKLTIQPGLEPPQILLLGAFRPVVGAIFALAFFLFIRSGLVPIAIPESLITQLYFFPAIGFIAGFSERLAQDTIKGAEESLPSVKFPSA